MPPSYVHGACDVPLLGETIGENLRHTVERVPAREALVDRGHGYRASYQELWDATTKLAKALMARDIQKGDRVAIWAPNRFEWVLTQYATARIGAILVNINPAYKARELAHALNQSGTRLLLLSQGFRQTSYTALLDEVRAGCRELKEALVIDEQWQALLGEASTVDDATLAERESLLSFDDPINIQYTSGTTGTPKGATLSHHNILNNGFFCGEILGYSDADRVCIPVPFYHCFGMVIGNLACTSHGACIVIPGETFEPGQTLATLEAERCTSLYGVPTMFISQLSHPDIDRTDFSHVRTGVMAGSPCPEEIMRQVRDRMNMREVTICYGMTETSPVSTQTYRDDPVEKQVGSVGRVHPHVEVKVIDPDTGQVIQRGTSGELCTRGYLVMRGYWNNATATADAIDSGRWMHTGDLATIDDDGYVAIVGRIKDMIIRGGENISPREIEELLLEHAAVKDAQVIGIPSDKYGEEVMAWVQPQTGSALTADDLTAYCTGQLSTFKIPRFWKLVNSFPMTVTGKVQKYRMREIAIAERASEPDPH